jgi:putative ABC transport system permease protein
VNLLVGSLTIGFILSVLALGVYVSYRVFDFADITTDGSITLGAATAAVLLVRGTPPILATLAGAAAGAAAGTVTGLLATRFRIPGLLSGILVMTALYSVNLRVMGRSNVPLLSVPSLAEAAEKAGRGLAGGAESASVLGWDVPVRDLAMLAGAFLVALLVGVLLYLFFRTNLGTAMRATGNNAQMIRALGVDTGRMTVAGLALANGLVGLSGALLAQYQGFADVQMGIGMVVWGFASVIIGEALVRSRLLGLALSGAVLGCVLFRLLIALALRWGLEPNDLKLVTAAFVFAALVLPRVLERTGRRKEAARA